jgi:hypothetical protein
VPECQSGRISTRRGDTLIAAVRACVRGCVGAQCSICLGEFETGEHLRRLPCQHSFHSDCIASWLGVKHTCPLCVAPVVAPRQPPAAAAEGGGSGGGGGGGAGGGSPRIAPTGRSDYRSRRRRQPPSSVAGAGAGGLSRGDSMASVVAVRQHNCATARSRLPPDIHGVARPCDPCWWAADLLASARVQTMREAGLSPEDIAAISRVLDEESGGAPVGQHVAVYTAPPTPAPRPPTTPPGLRQGGGGRDAASTPPPPLELEGGEVNPIGPSSSSSSGRGVTPGRAAWEAASEQQQQP